MDGAATGRFAQLGYLEPFPVLDRTTRQRLVRAVQRLAEPRTWNKGLVPVSRPVYEVATHPALVAAATELLGPDVVVWGAELLLRQPGAFHRWHSDAEAYLTDGPVVTVWLGVDGVDQRSGLHLLPGSHAYGCSPQQAAHERGVELSATFDSDAVLALAEAFDPAAEVYVPPVSDGDALVFDGRLWHGSINRNRRQRTSLILQYAAASTPLYAPQTVDWPFERAVARPPCVMVSGRAALDRNVVVPPPAPDGEAAAVPDGWIERLPSPLPAAEDGGWRIHGIYEGPTESIAYLESHASSLGPGDPPHPPHTHIEEELLLVLAGQVELVLPDPADPAGEPRIVPATRGTLAYYPLDQAHTIRTVGDAPADYLMFKWAGGDAEHGLAATSTAVVQLPDVFSAMPDDDGFTTRLLFEGPTRYLWKVHAHASVLAPGGGYAAHVDPYDVALVVLEGEVRTESGEPIGPNGIVFCPRGRPHGLTNDGPSVARYVTIELHGASIPAREVGAARRLARRLLPYTVKHNLKKLLPVP